MKDLFGEELTCNRFQISREVLSNVLCKELKNISLDQIVPLFYNKTDAIVDFVKLCNGDRTGSKISLLFNPHRLSTPYLKAVSVYEALQKDDFFSNLARAFIFLSSYEKRDFFRVAVGLGTGGIFLIGEFPPYVAKDFYIKYQAKKILDPCAGWGGRMIGAASIGAFYHGIDPSTQTCKGLMKLGHFLKKFETGFDFRITCKPFEEVELDETYDFALTSPPYYDTERYAEESTQSFKKFNSFEKWSTGFLLPLIKNTLKHTKNGFVINVGSRKYPLQKTIEENFKCTVLGNYLNNSNVLGRNKKQGEVFIYIKQ